MVAGYDAAPCQVAAATEGEAENRFHCTSIALIILSDLCTRAVYA